MVRIRPVLNFRVVEESMQDGGYWVDLVEPLLPSRDGAVDGESSDRDRSDDADDDGPVDECDLVRNVKSKYEEWEKCVRTNSWERHPSHMDEVRRLLEDMPPDDEPGKLALWIAAAINPLPPLGVAPEIRPSVLSAADDAERLTIIRDALDESLRVVAERRGTIRLCGLSIHAQVLVWAVLLPVIASLAFSADRPVGGLLDW